MEHIFPLVDTIRQRIVILDGAMGTSIQAHHLTEADYRGREFTDHSIARPSFTGIRVFDPVPLEDIVPFIDWTPFFHAWELRGVFPKILDAPEVGIRARELWDDSKKLLGNIVSANSLTARAVIGFFPAASVGDDIEIFSDGSAHTSRAVPEPDRTALFSAR